MRPWHVELGQVGEQRDHLAIQLEPAARGQVEGAADAALAQAGERRPVGLAERRCVPREQVADGVLGKGPERQMAAARADRRQQPAGRVTDQQQQRVRRRLLERLEQRIGGVRVQVVGRIDDHHAPAALGRGHTQEMVGRAHVVDDDFRARLAGLLVDPALEGPQVRMSAGGDPLEGLAPRIDGQGRGCATEQVGRPAAGQDEAREAVGQRRLADAARPRDQPGVRQTARIEGAEQRALGRLVAAQLRVGARRRRAVVLLARFGHGKATPRRAATQARTPSWTASTSPLASIRAQRSGARPAISRKPWRRRAWKARSRPS